MNRGLRILAVTLITAGLVILADVGLTLIWKEPVSAVYGSVRQGAAAEELDTVEADFQRLPELSSIDSEGDSTQRARQLADVFEGTLEDQKPIGRIDIPAIGADYVVVQGTDTEALQRGPGHYPETALPGQGRTIGIAGHRTTYLAPFLELDKLEASDSIRLEVPYGTFTYEITGTRIVEPSQTEVVRDVGRERLVLTTCNPRYSAAQRLVVFADLEKIDLKAGAV